VSRIRDRIAQVDAERGLAVDGGAPDNITCIVADVDG
jgi:hypothetical protein